MGRCRPCPRRTAPWPRTSLFPHWPSFWSWRPLAINLCCLTCTGHRLDIPTMSHTLTPLCRWFRPTSTPHRYFQVDVCKTLANKQCHVFFSVLNPLSLFNTFQRFFQMSKAEKCAVFFKDVSGIYYI